MSGRILRVSDVFSDVRRFFFVEVKNRRFFFDYALRRRLLRKDGEIMMTVEEMKAVDVRTVDRDALVDINEVKIDRSLPREERIRSFVEQIKNPYCFKCGEVVVKTSFADTDRTLEDCVEHYLRNL
jgi:hypothetical protein